MVYRGTPSKACLPCRRRKLICDLNPNGCSSCRRATLNCTGYRNTDALRIKDETAVVRRKVEQRQLGRTPSIYPVNFDLCHQAKDVFYHSYVIGTAKPYDFLRRYYDTSSESSHLVVCIDAVALACLNYQQHASRMGAEARKKYVYALQLTQSALQNPQIAAQDSTLLAILLLDLYEKITSQVPTLESSWATHLEGALTLVRLRGCQQFRDPQRIQILVRLTTNMLISCVAADREVPLELANLRQTVSASFLQPSDPKWRESQLMISFARFKHEIRKGLIDSEEILATAKHLDSQFKDLSLDINESWKYRVVNVLEKSPHHFENHHHEYPLEQMMQMWNVLRLTRILLNEHICEHSHTHDSNHQGAARLQPTQMQNARNEILALSSEICASVPQYICDLSEVGIADKYVCSENFHRARAAQATQHLPCYRLIFPLFIVGRSAWSSKALKQYVSDQLQFLSSHHHIKNAAKVADILESVENPDPWQVYTMLGSYAFVC